MNAHVTIKKSGAQLFIKLIYEINMLDYDDAEVICFKDNKLQLSIVIINKQIMINQYIKILYVSITTSVRCVSAQVIMQLSYSWAYSGIFKENISTSCESNG